MKKLPSERVEYFEQDDEKIPLADQKICDKYAPDSSKSSKD